MPVQTENLLGDRPMGPLTIILSSIIDAKMDEVFWVVAGTILKPLNGGLPSQRSVGYRSMSDNLRTLLQNR